MATIADIKKRATELSGKTAPNSITPKEVGQLFYDLAGAVPEGGTGGGGVPVVDIAELDGYNLNAGVIMATGPMRFAVACDVGGPSQYSVGVCEMFSDNMMHQTTQVLTTHYTLDADGTVNRVAHTDGRLHTYWRSCKIGGDAAWGAWTPLYSYNGDGYVYRGVATPETAPTGTDTPWCRVFYLAGPGTYKNFGGLTVEPGELAALLYDGNGTSGSWRKETVPASSGSLRLDEVVDLSGITDGTKWTDDDKVNALYNIRNGSYVYCGAGDGGQAASVELTQDSAGSRLEIALLGTDGHLKVYAADISDADVTATWSVKDYDLSQVAGLPDVLSRLTDVEGKLVPNVQIRKSTDGTINVNLDRDVVVVNATNENKRTLDFSGSPAPGHHTTVFIKNGNSLSNSNQYGAFLMSFSSAQHDVHMVNSPDTVWVAPNGYLRVDAVYTGTDTGLYLSLERSGGGSCTESGVRVSAIRPFFDRVTISNTSKSYPIGFTYTPEVGHTMDIVSTATDTTETIAFPKSADVYGVQLSDDRTFSFTNCSINIAVKFISTARFVCIVSAPATYTKEGLKILETSDIESINLSYDLIYAEVSKSFQNINFSTLYLENGHETHIYVKSSATIKLHFYTSNVSSMFGNTLYVPEGRTVRLDVRYIKDKPLFLTAEKAVYPYVVSASDLFNLPIYADIVNMDNPESETLRFGNGATLESGRIVYVNIHSDSGLMITFNTDWTVHGFELDRINRGVFKGPCNILIKIWCVSDQKNLVTVLYTPLYTPETTEGQSATLSVNETETEQFVIQPAALPPAKETEGVTSG